MEDGWELAPCETVSLAAACNMPACRVRVVRQDEFVGFKLQHAHDRHLQVSRRTRRLVLASSKFGVYEQMRILQVTFQNENSLAGHAASTPTSSTYTSHLPDHSRIRK